ncbi:MAG: hypothetical protein ABWY18_01675 [Tardiphaga sp.]
MAEEAFALSPISARPTVPGEADYDAIREAFMETARGRWFLAEYAKRNRTADTNMVLEAVTRLEANLAAQKQPPALSMTAALGAIRPAVRQAKATAIEAMPRADSDETLTGARNGARIIREIAWTLRECGADTRICDLLDAQVKAIEAGQQSWTGNGREEVLASYDVLMQRIEQIAEGGATVVSVEPAHVAPEPPQTAEARASVTPLFKTTASEPVVETAAAVQAQPAIETQAVAETAVVHDSVADESVDYDSVAEAMVDTVAEAGSAETIAESSFDLAATMAEAATETPDDATATLDADAQHDLEVLDMVALEMGAPDPDDVFDAPVATQEPAAEPVVAATVAPLDTDLMTLAQIAEAALAPEPAPFVAQQPEPAASSLGAALIAHGVIANPNAPANDTLAPIRKMTQAEKIAFFS